MNSLWKDRVKYKELIYIHPEELRCLVGQPDIKTRKFKFAGSTPLKRDPSAFIDLRENSAENFNRLWIGKETASPAFSSPIKQPHYEDTRIMYGLYIVVNFREFLYSALGAAARYGEEGIFAISDALKSVPSVIFNEIETMENRHLARLIQTFLCPYIKYCPSRLWEQALLPILDSLLKHVFQRLLSYWRFIPNPNNAGIHDQSGNYNTVWDPIIWKPLEEQDIVDSDDISASVGRCDQENCGKCLHCCQKEVARDASIRLLENSFIDLIKVIIGIEGDTSKEPRDIVPSAFGQHVLQSETLANEIFLSLVTMIISSDGYAVAKATHIIKQSLFCGILAHDRFHRFAVDRLFSACLFRIHTMHCLLYC